MGVGLTSSRARGRRRMSLTYRSRFWVYFSRAWDTNVVRAGTVCFANTVTMWCMFSRGTESALRPGRGRRKAGGSPMMMTW